MDQNVEYHDPDYPGTSVQITEEAPELSEEHKIEKIKSIIRREFSNELEVRENEVMLIEQRLSTSRRILQRLRYALVSSFYKEQKLQVSNSQIEDDVAMQTEPRARAEVSTVLREAQRNIHPSLRKLLGKETVDLSEIFMARSLRNKTRKNYSAMLQTRNYTIAADTTKSLRPEQKTEPEAPPETEEGAAGGSRPKKVPRHLEPRVERVLTVDDPTRNKMKHRYRLIVGNTSKYAPAASRLDRSTHKWLLYVRGPAGRPDPSPALTHVVARLHASYAPHHTVHVYKAPFHISRRGWGEFPAVVELHFPTPDVNRPASIEHTIKLDRNYTGLQTLGAETIVDVWLYSTPEMLEFEYVDPIPTPIAETEEQADIHTAQEPEETEEVVQIKQEIFEVEENSYSDNWMEFFSKDTTELDVDEMIIKPAKKVEEKNDDEFMSSNLVNNDKEIKSEPLEINNDLFEVPPELLNQPVSIKKRIMKYIDATTGKIYYLEMDRTLDLSKVQEIVINNSNTAKISPIKANGLKNVRKKKGVSLLKPEVQSQLKSDSKEKVVVNTNFAHIENDHCYLGSNWAAIDNIDKAVLPEDEFSVASTSDRGLYDRLCFVASNFSCVRMAVNYMLQKLPVITEAARDPEYNRFFPFAVENDEKYWKLDFAKRRNIEWTRAKLINKILLDHFKYTELVWKTKQILIFSRLHGYHPIRPELTYRQPESEEWSSWNDLESSRKSESNIKEIYPNPSDICSLTVFNSEEYLKDSHDDTEKVSDSDEVVDVLCCDKTVTVKQEVLPDDSDILTVLPVENDDDRLRFMFIERICSDIGVELRNEDVGNGYSYSAVHAVLMSAMKSYAEELTRGSLAEKLTEDLPEDTLPPVWVGSARTTVLGAHVFAAVVRTRRLAVGARALATPATDTQAL